MTVILHYHKKSQLFTSVSSINPLLYTKARDLMRKDGSYQWRLLIAESVVEENRPGKTGRVVWPSDQRKTRQT